MVAYADLGGLGAKQGTPVFYEWVAPSLMPQFLPWLMILVLLLLKPNRCASAWWIWIPLACVWGVTVTPHSILSFLPSAQLDMFLELISALGFGAAAVWLLSGHLAWKHRMLAFAGILLAQVGFNLLAYVLGHGTEFDTPQMGIPLALSAVVISVALSLAGLVCRGRYGWLRVSLWLMAALAVVWLLVIGPFFFAEVFSRGNVPMAALFGLVGMAAGITFGALLPFLVLSFANGFFRERLKGLLHLGDAQPPPVISPPMPVVAQSAGS